MTSPPPPKAPGSHASKKQRVDVLLVERGLAETRAKAQALVLAGEVFRGDERVDKPGTTIASDSPLTVRSREKYVSRGGLKLEGALADLAFDPKGLVAADVGASTGGFTDCLLQHGAERVYAIDVGQGQLAHRLVTDARVVVMDRQNARFLEAEQVGGGVDLAVVDASFISLDKLLEALARIVRSGGALLALIKPQFEVGREEAGRGKGVIKDPELRQRAINGVLEAVKAQGFWLVGDAPCRVPGPKGNVEHFVLARRV
jgi:23S rRNA (cytidine1920-2'-O)/16S rRNA (cytidine1409-2'-O)-methyltransferase